LNFGQGIHALLAEKKEGTLRQLVAEERIDKVYRFSRPVPADTHEERGKEGGEYP